MAPRTRIAVAASFTLCTMLLTACGSSTQASSTGGDGGGVVKLSMLTGFTGPDKPSYDALIKQFNATHPKIQVTMDAQPWDAVGQKLPQSWATGQGPDIATPSSDPGSIFNYINTNSVLPLDSAVGTGDGKIESAVFPEAVRKAFTVNGKLYAVPANLATLVLYYNKAMFTSAGITSAPKTEDEFIADAKKLTKSEGGKITQYGLTLADHATIQMWPILQWMSGGEVVDSSGCAQVVSAASISALQKWSNLVTQNKISPVGQTGADADTLFSAKKAAMEINGPWAAAGFRSAGVDLGIAQVPVGSAGPVTLGSTVPLMIERQTKHAPQAQEFLAWWTGKTAQTAFSKSSGFPPTRTDLADAVASDPTVSVFAAALPSARLYLAGQPKATQIDTDAYVPMIQKITRGADVTATAQATAKQINQITGCKS